MVDIEGRFGLPRPFADVTPHLQLNIHHPEKISQATLEANNGPVMPSGEMLQSFEIDDVVFIADEGVNKVLVSHGERVSLSNILTLFSELEDFMDNFDASLAEHSVTSSYSVNRMLVGDVDATSRILYSFNVRSTDVDDVVEFMQDTPNPFTQFLDVEKTSSGRSIVYVLGHGGFVNELRQLRSNAAGPRSNIDSNIEMKAIVLQDSS